MLLSRLRHSIIFTYTCIHFKNSYIYNTILLFIFFIKGEDLKDIFTVVDDYDFGEEETYAGLRTQDLQEAKDQLLVETADMLNLPLFTAEALLRNNGKMIINLN